MTSTILQATRSLRAGLLIAGVVGKERSANGTSASVGRADAIMAEHSAGRRPKVG